MKRIIFLTGVAGALIFAITSVIGGLQIEGYNPISQYISESYATGIPNSVYLQYAFMASGILLTLFGLLAPAAFPKSKGIKTGFIIFGIFYGLGTVLTGFFPCDLGCPSEGANLTISQFIHNIAGFFTYVVVPFCLIGLGIAFRKFAETKALARFSLLSGVVSLAFVIFLFSNPKGQFIGVFQRIVEVSILSWIIYCCFFTIGTSNK